MKKWIVLAIVLWPMMAWGFTAGSAWNWQAQQQDMGALDGGVHGMISGIHQAQAGLGGSAANAGSQGAEGQAQVQGIDYTFNNGYASHSYHSETLTSGGSHAVGPGIAGHVEGTKASAGAVTLGDGVGRAGVAGSAMRTRQGSGSFSSLGSSAGTGTYFKAVNGYKYVNAGSTSYTSHTGVQSIDAGTATDTHGGAAGSGFRAAQAGRTAAGNDGNGGAMVGSGAAKSTAGITTGVLGNGSAHARVEQSQVHSYEQGSAGTGRYQYQTGFVATYNNISH